MKVPHIQNFIIYKWFRLLVLFFALFFGGCAHFYYLPGNMNVPLFTEKNEFRGSAALGGGLTTAGIDVQTAMSLTDHIGIMANYMHSKYYPDDIEDNNLINYNYFEGAAGYFKPFEKFWIFEIYGGIGSASQHHEYYAWPENVYRGQANLTFMKYFLQPSIGVTFKSFDVALSTGFSRLNFTKINNSVDPESIYHDDLDLISENSKLFLFEPAITIRGGWKYVKAQLQYIVSANLSSEELTFDPYKFSVGIYISLAKKYRNNNNISP